MRSGPDPARTAAVPSAHKAARRAKPLTVAEYGSVDDLPDAARALLTGDFFSSPTWYRTVAAAAVPAGTRPLFVAWSTPDRVLAVLPMLVSMLPPPLMQSGGGALTTPYTCLWRPLLAPGLDAHATAAVWRGLARWCRRFACVRLDCLDEAVADEIAAGVRGHGLVPLAFEHFGNWHGLANRGWATYLAGRPGHLREALRRRGGRLEREGATFRLFTGADEAAAAIDAYEAVYAKSWKTAEPYPDFNRALMMACAQNGSLRLGLLSHDGAVMAAQFWVVEARSASILKLAHDDASKGHSPGTVLTAWMIQQLMARDGVKALDFGRGDDGYKAGWAANRRQRMGLVLANPWRPGGLATILRHRAGIARKAWAKAWR